MKDKIGFGSVVKIKTDQRRHDTTSFPVALIMDEGAPTTGGNYRWHGLFLDDWKEPTDFAWANLYADEIDSQVKVLSEAEVIQIMNVTREMRR